MRVLAVTPWWPTAARPSFAPFMLRDVELLQKDHQVVVLHLVHPDDYREDEPELPGVRVLRIPYHHTRPETWLPAARKIRELGAKANAVHTMALPALIPTRISGTKKPWIHTEHYSALVEPSRSKRQDRALEFLKSFFAFPDQIISVSDSLAEIVNRHRHVPSAVIGNYVRMLSPQRSAQLSALEAGQPLRIVAVGGLIDRKGPIETVQAVAELRRRGYGARLRWIGVGPLEGEVRDLTRTLGIEEFVDLSGAASPEEVGEALAAADLFMLPTAAETFGVALAEALGHGLPVISSGVGGHLGFLPARGSRIVERNGTVLADAAESLLTDPQTMGREELVAYARSLFSDDARLRAYREVYRQVFPGLDNRPVAVFHAPYPLQDDPAAASALRPRKMRDALESCGYRVLEVTGYAKGRKAAMKRVERAVSGGLHIDFIYGENATIPNAFTQPRHFPLHPFLDSRFFARMRDAGVPAGVYYRDIYWKFPEYTRKVGSAVAAVMKVLYRLELAGYSRSLDALFVQTLQMASWLPDLQCQVAALPPGADFVDRPFDFEPGRERLNLLYVGGVEPSHYDLTVLLTAVQGREDVSLTVCVRRGEWAEVADRYRDLLDDNTRVVHKGSGELGELYQWAHVCLLYMDPTPYREFVLPVKLFEYAGNGRPILASSGTYAGTFVERERIGWSIPYGVEELQHFIELARTDAHLVEEAALGARNFGKRNTWVDRARQVAEALRP